MADLLVTLARYTPLLLLSFLITIVGDGVSLMCVCRLLLFAAAGGVCCASSLNLSRRFLILLPRSRFTV